MPTTQLAAAASTTTTTTATMVITAGETESAEDGGTTSDGAMGSGPHNGREARNLAEKHRRDKLNASIQELSTMVPHVAEATRRLDKTAVLRFATHGLRLQYVFGKATSKKQQQHQQHHHQQQQQSTHALPLLTDALLQLLDSFFITLTCHGQIVLVSTSVEQLLGHCQSDLYGQNIMQITHPEDQEMLRQQLIPRDMDSLFRSAGWQMQQQHTAEDYADGDDDDEGGDDDGDGDELAAYHRAQQQQQQHDNANYYRTPSPRSQAYIDDDIDRRLRADRRCFIVRLARSAIRSEAARQYECVKIDGCFRRSDCSNTTGSFPIVSQLIRRSRSTQAANSCSGGSGGSGGGGVGVSINGTCQPSAAGSGGAGGGATTAGGAGGFCSSNFLQHDVIAQAALHGISGNDIVLVAMARIIRPPKVLNRMSEPNQLEYRTRHLIDGRIIDCDQRIGLVAGYMKDEVRNLSPFSFIHLDDVRWVIVALRQMYDCNSDYGESCYRLISRNGHFIYLQTKGYLEIDKSTNKVHSFVCINTLLDEAQGRRKVQEMKDKFSAIIKTKIPSSSVHDAPAAQNPQQLERIVLYLIENLQKQQQPAAHMVAPQATHAAPLFTNSSSATAQQQRCNAGTPPTLALVPPEPASVRNSITRSVSVVNVTAAKNLLYLQRNSPTGSYQGSSDASLSPASSGSEEATYDSIAATANGNIENVGSNAKGGRARSSVLKMAARQRMKSDANANLSTPTNTPESSPSTPRSMAMSPQTPTKPQQQPQQQHQQPTLTPTLASTTTATTHTTSLNHRTTALNRIGGTDGGGVGGGAAVQVSVLKRLHSMPSNYCDDYKHVEHDDVNDEASDCTSPAKRATSVNSYTRTTTNPSKAKKPTTTINKFIARSMCQKPQQQQHQQPKHQQPKHQLQQQQQQQQQPSLKRTYNSHRTVNTVNSNGINENQNMMMMTTPTPTATATTMPSPSSSTSTHAMDQKLNAAIRIDQTLASHAERSACGNKIAAGMSGGGGGGGGTGESSNKKFLTNLNTTTTTTIGFNVPPTQH